MVSDKYNTWLSKATKDSDLIKELESIKGNESEISDRFYKNLDFGTAGLRGKIGAGTNRMNIYTVGSATQGLAEYINSKTKSGSVAIAYDSRIKSDLFAKHAACILAANGITVHLYPELVPTPMLSFAVRHLKCDAGIVITASHNPAIYNGYKAYGPDGCQLSPEASSYVMSIIEKVDLFDGVKICDYDFAVSEGKIRLIGNEVFEAYLNEVQAQSVSDDSYRFSDLKVVYTPLHGAGNKPVREILKRIGVQNVSVVKEQELPDGNFPTVKFPNPEFKEAFECALKLAKTENPDLLLATDPDSDRVGIAVKQNNEYRLLSGNDVGVLLLNYLLLRKKQNGTLPESPVAVSTIVSTNMTKAVAKEYGCELREVLTGFKFIGGVVHELEQKHEENRFIMGFEESYGYLIGGYVRDKDAVVASMLICEMCCYYLNKGKTLIDVLEELFKKYGYYCNSQKSLYFDGEDGMKKMSGIMENLRKNPPKELAGIAVAEIADYELSVRTNIATQAQTKIMLPKSNVLSYTLQDGSQAMIRPSGTEPKIKIYMKVLSDSAENGKKQDEKIYKSMRKIMNV